MTEITLKEVEVSKINLKPGDILGVTIKDDDINSIKLEELRNRFQELFPYNQVLMFGVGPENEVRFSVIGSPTKNIGCGTQSYCSDCSCGKKERNEATDQLTAETEKLDLYKNDF
jgi:fumarylacetoacetate (FAA) hydrolase family protein